MKRDRHGFRVLSFSVFALLFACLVAPRAVTFAAPQSQSPDDQDKKQTKPKDDVTEDTPGRVIRPGKALKMDVDLALVNVTVTDPYNRLVTGLEKKTSEFTRTTSSRK